MFQRIVALVAAIGGSALIYLEWHSAIAAMLWFWLFLKLDTIQMAAETP